MTRTFGLVYLIAIIFQVIPGGCQKDTCNQTPTFVQMKAQGAEQLSPQEVEFVIGYQAGANLPVDYYEAAHLNPSDKDPYGKTWQNDYAIVNSLRATDSTLILQLNWPMLIEGKSPLLLHYVLLDRRDYMDCQHPGGADSYYLDLTLSYSAIEGIVQFTELEWEETLQKGAF